MEKRIDFIDLAKGICILLVVLYHVRGPLRGTDLNRVLLCFRLPLYFFLSGLFFKKYSGFWNLMLRKFNKLLVPFFFFMGLTYTFYCFGLPLIGHYHEIFQLPHDILIAFEKDDVFLNTPLWFLLSLFETSIIFYFVLAFCDILKINEKVKKILIIILCFMIGIYGYELGVNKTNLPLWIDTSMTAIPFYCTGYFVRADTDFLIPNRLDKYIPAFLVVMGLTVYFLADNIMMITNEYHGSFISFYLSAISGTLFVLLLSKCVNKVPVVSYLGRYSVIVLCTHWALLWVLRQYLIFITNAWILSAVLFLLVIFLSIPVSKFFLRFFPKFVSQVDLIKVD
ncbi:acyltransferase family protein [uncultured Bacteroides sp.]|uniref:acyltransferase family protein n=1 Tax=uncultured Bacteroides sp. TaxID=162156 RepID=UPI002AABBE4B|nr:acyltransferase family protein [uncultured Bacteroides sp.]